MDRKGYAKLQTEVRKQQSETLRRFHEQNPEAFERLLKRAQEELKAEESLSPIERLDLRRGTPTTTIRPEELERRIAALDARIYDPQERHYYVHTKDEWGTPHLYFESFIPTPTTEEVLDELHRRHPNFSGQIVSIEPCVCPACLQRQPL